MKFPMLYKKASSGAIVEWKIWTEGNKVFTEWGQQGGKKQTSEDVIKEGKNLGKVNATTPEQQADVEAKAQWEKKLKKDYTKTLNDAQDGKASDLVEGGILPMLAQKYRDHAAKIVFPALVQPKLDGHRCVAVVDSKGKCTLWSRTRKPITGLSHIVQEIEGLDVNDIVFDGELYNHEYHDKFEQLTHFIRQEEDIPGNEIVHYYVYDIADPSLDNSARNEWLIENLGPKGIGCLTLVETREVVDEDDLMAAFDEFRSQHYEGAIVRNTAGKYVNKRSYDLQKIKEMDDSEFIITGISEGRGKLAGHGIFVCKTKTGSTFEAKMRGDMSALKEYYEHPKKYIGKKLTVQFQGYTAKNEVPRFPVALRVRED
jgi:DNA ligase 1